MIARAAQADRGIVMRDGTDPTASAQHPFTWVILRGHLANATQRCISWVTDADWPISANGATSVLATVGLRTHIGGGNAIVAISKESMVADTQGFIVAGYYTMAVTTAGDI